MRLQCTAPDCQKPQTARGLCAAHYHHVLMAEPRPPCSVEGCERPSRTKGLCNTHYVQAGRTGGDPTGHLPGRERATCTIEGCGEPAVGRGYCRLHWGRWRRQGDPLTVISPTDTRNIDTCEHCGKAFPAKPSRRRRFCSWACADAGKREPDRTCLVCGKTFHANPAKLARGDGKYCSIACFGISKRGPEVCSVEGCGRKSVAHGLCRRHDPKSVEAAHRAVEKRRARLLGAFVEAVDRVAIYERDRGLCWLCKQPVERDCMTLDHVVPLALGGLHEPTNTRLAHKSCNSKRGIRYEGQLPLLLVPPKREYLGGHPRSKLTDEQALEILRLRSEGAAVRELAERFGVSQQVVYMLCWGKRRKHLVRPSADMS